MQLHGLRRRTKWRSIEDAYAFPEFNSNGSILDLPWRCNVRSLMCSINRLLREGLAALRQEQIGAEDSVAPVEFLYRLTDAMANAEATSRSDQEDDFWFGQACRAPAKSRISRAALAWVPDSVDTARPSRQLIGPEKMILETCRARFFVLCLALCSTAAAPALAETLIADQNGCKAVNPHPQPNQSITWSGGCKDGLLFGPGVLQLLQDGLLDASYQGDFWHGQLSGHGVATLRDGSRYDGNFTNSVFAGEGSMTWRNGDRYQGHWSAGKRNGHGELQQSAGAHYEGDFYNNLYDGHGVMHFADHSIYEGGWSAGKRAGQGKQTNPDGTSFVATFQNDRPVGQVLLQTPDGIQRHLLVAEGQLADANQTGSKRCLEKSGHQLIYPPAASNNNIFSGQSRVHFDLDQDGQLTHIRSIESTNAIFDEAALAFVTELNCQSGLAEKTTWTLNFKTAGDEAHPVPEIGPPADITDGRRVLLLRVLESDLPHVNSHFDHFARNVGEGFAMRVSAMLRSRGISVAHLLDLDLNRAVADKIRDGARLEKARFVIVPRIDKPSGEFAGSVKVTVDFYQLPENVPAGDADPLFSKSYSVAIPLRGERPVGIAEMAQDVVDSLEKDGRLSVLEARCDAHLCAQPEAAK